MLHPTLKKMIGEEQDKWLRENGVAMDKENLRSTEKPMYVHLPLPISRPLSRRQAFGPTTQMS
jgi:hypothetical protein